MNAPRPAARDAALSAIVMHRSALRFGGGADAALDRPAHVRAGSGLALAGGRIVVVQDDANFLALIDPRRPDAARAIALPRGADGGRQFGDSRGNKHLKLDLEACVADDAAVVAFGSGSTPAREVVLMVSGVAAEEPGVRLVAVPRFYRALRDAADFAGSELNVEGALLLGDTLRLFARGNGAARDGRLPVNASCDLSWRALRDHLDAPEDVVPPAPTRIQPYALGTLGGVPLGFTDATAWDDVVLFTAAAEASPDAVRDGDVVGSVIGILDAGAPRWAPISDERGEPVLDKVEGVLVAEASAGELWVVADPDDEHRPSELWRVRLEGPWRRAPLNREA